MSEKVLRVIVNSVIDECGKKYNFDSEEAKRMVDGMCFPESSISKKSSKSIPLPYSDVVVECNCDGLSYNHGLYTQCENVKSGDRYCCSCDKEAKKNESGEPDYGTIQLRKAVDIFEYVDSKGKSPIAYMKVMKKLKLSKEEVLEEAKKRNIFVDERHLEIGELKRGRPKTVIEKSPKGAKGRPKKSKKTLELTENNNEEEDLFASLVAAASKEASKEDTIMASKEDTIMASKEDTIMASKEDTIMASEEAVNDATVVKEKVEKPKKEPKEKVEKPKKEPKEKVEKPKKEPKEKVEKPKKEPKEKVEKPKKEPKEKVEKPKKEPKEKVEKPKKEPKEKVEKPKKETEEEADVVKRFEFEGVKYLKSKKSGVIYNMEQDVVGKWNEKENKIDFNECESEEEEEEYDED
jgi:hypothetical protein